MPAINGDHHTVCLLQNLGVQLFLFNSIAAYCSSEEIPFLIAVWGWITALLRYVRSREKAWDSKHWWSPIDEAMAVRWENLWEVFFLWVWVFLRRTQAGLEHLVLNRLITNLCYLSALGKKGTLVKKGKIMVWRTCQVIKVGLIQGWKSTPGLQTVKIV